MKRIIDLSRPDILFGIFWGSTLALQAAVPVTFTVPSDARVQWLIYSNIASFFIIYLVTDRLVGRKNTESRVDLLQAGSWDAAVLVRFMRLLLLAWGALYALTIAYSGGLPIVWVLMGSGKSYQDFGVPTLTGLLNMTRAFVLTGYVLIYFQTKNRRWLWTPLLLLLTAAFEISRGAILVLLAQAVGVMLLRRQPTLFRVMRLMLLVGLAVLAFGALGTLRGANLNTAGLAGDQDWFVNLPVGVFFAFAYLVSPVNNLYFGASAVMPSYVPYFTLAALLPTVLRTIIFPQLGGGGVYAFELQSAAFNTLTFYAPMLADFGWVGAGLIVCGIQVVCAYVHVRAKRGSYYYSLVYPPLFMCIILSVFDMFFFALITVCYPVLVSIFIRYRNARLKRRHQQALQASPGADFMDGPSHQVLMPLR